MTDVVVGDTCRVCWIRGCGWEESDYPRGRPGTIIGIDDETPPGVIGYPDVVEVRFDDRRSPRTMYTVRSMLIRERG